MRCAPAPALSFTSLALFLSPALALALGGCGGSEPQPASPPPKSAPTATWDLARLPERGKAQREWTTPTDVRVLVLRAGRSEGDAGSSAGLDLVIEGYLRDGQRFMQTQVALDRPGGMRSDALIPGLLAGIEKLEPWERRRILVPAAEAFLGDPPDPTVPRGADLIFDVTRSHWAAKDLAVGSGEVVRAGQTILAHYRGTLEDGTVFDDSRKNNKGEPARLPIQRPEGRRGGVIEGWLRGIPGMRVGGRRRLEIPAHLAYGARGSPNGAVPPHAHLTFVVEVVAIPPPTADEPASK